MSGRRKGGGGKAKIEMSKPELPPFLQRMREQIVANEDADRIAQSAKKRKERGERAEDPDEGPTVVKLDDDDLTEEEYKRMKLALETQYKLDSELKKGAQNEELDVDKLLASRRTDAAKSSSSSSGAAKQQEKSSKSKNAKKLAYDESSSSDDEDGDR